MKVFAELVVNNPKAARKFFVAVAAALAVLATALADGSVSPTEWIQVALAALGAFGVYAVPNKDYPEPE